MVAMLHACALESMYGCGLVHMTITPWLDSLNDHLDCCIINDLYHNLSLYKPWFWLNKWHFYPAFAACTSSVVFSFPDLQSLPVLCLHNGWVGLTATKEGRHSNPYGNLMRDAFVSHPTRGWRKNITWIFAIGSLYVTSMADLLVQGNISPLICM